MLGKEQEWGPTLVMYQGEASPGRYTSGRPHLVMSVSLTPGMGRMAQERSTMAWLWPPPTSTRSLSTGERAGGPPGSRDCNAPMTTLSLCLLRKVPPLKQELLVECRAHKHILIRQKMAVVGSVEEGLHRTHCAGACATQYVTE